MNRRPLSDEALKYLEARMAHEWEPAGRAYRRCTRCGKRQKVGARCRRYGQRTGNPKDYLCPKRNRPNRWRLHFRRELTRVERSRQKIDPMDVRLMKELWILEAAAKQLPQDVRTWAGHPVARRHRRIVRRLWTMPLSTEAAALSPTMNRRLTVASDMRPGHTYGGSHWLDHQYSKRNKLLQGLRQELGWHGLWEDQARATWRQQCGFPD